MTPMGDASGDEDGVDEARPMSEINVTPLVDVMLVLLIVFMVAAPMMMVGVPVQLPRSAAPRVAQSSPPVIVTVARDGRVFLRQEEVAEAELGARLSALRAAEPGEAPIYLRGDRSVVYGDIMRVMGRIAQAGVGRVSLISEADGGGAAATSPARAR
jgi:biopolymer transport protein TolR